jgi:hypothetical protein
MIEKYSGLSQTTDAQRFGTAFHALLQPAQSHKALPRRIDSDALSYVVDVEGQEVRIPIHVFAGAMNAFEKDRDSREGGRFYFSSKLAVWEHRKYKEFGNYGALPIVVTGQADVIYPNAIVEFKTTGQTINCDRYLNSLQWQYYACIFGMPQVSYFIWEINFTGLTRKFIERKPEIQINNPGCLDYAGDRIPVFRNLVRQDCYADPASPARLGLLSEKARELCAWLSSNALLDRFLTNEDFDF